MMGRGKREDHRPRALSIFFRLLLFLLGYPAGAFAEEYSNPASTRIHGGKRTNLTTHCWQVLLHIK